MAHHDRSARRFALRALMIAGALVVMPAAASATTIVSLSGGQLTITGDGAASKIEFDTTLGTIGIKDSTGASVMSNGSCSQTGIASVDCGLEAGVTKVVANLGDGDDSYKWASVDPPQTIDGGPGNDTIETGNGKDTVTGGPGNDDLNGGRGDDTVDGGEGDDKVDGWDGSDTVIGGPGRDNLLGDGGTIYSGGNDTILARDGDTDTVDCGGGADTAQVDVADVVVGCVSIDRPVVGGGTNNGGGSTPTPAPPLAALAVTGAVTKTQSPSKLSKGKKLAVQLTSNRTCTGRISIAVTKSEAKRLKIGKVAMSIGTSDKVTVPGGAPTTITVAIDKKHRKRIAKASKVKATVIIVCAEASGNAFTGSAAVTIKR